MRERGERKLVRSFLGALLLVSGLGIPPAGVSGAVTGPAIVGTITDAAGPLPGRSVSICDGSSPDFCSYVDGATTDASGGYQVADLAPGDYFVEVSGDATHPAGFHAAGAPGSYAATIEAATLVTVVDSPVTADVTLPILPTISATVTRVGGAAVADAPLQVCLVDGWQCEYGSTDAAGRYTSPALTPGSYALQVDAPSPNPLGVIGGYYRKDVAGNYTAAANLASAIAVTSGDTAVSIALPKGLQITGTVRGPGNLPVGNAPVTICDADYGYGCSWAGSATTSSTGDYASDLLTPGSYRISVGEPDPNPGGLLPGFYRSGVTGNFTASYQLATTITLTTADAVANVTLPKGLRISGTVTGPGGTPVEGARASVCDAADRTDCSGVSTDLPTDAAGVWHSEPLPAGSYLVRVDAPDSNPNDLLSGYYRTGVAGSYTPDIASASAITLTTADATANVSLPKGIRIVGVVSRTDGTAFAGASVSICTTAATDYCSGVTPDGTSASDGSYRTGIVSPGGSYLVHVDLAWNDTSGAVGGWYATTGLVRTGAEASVVTMTTGDRRLDLALPTGVQFGGRITGPTAGTPAARASVDVCRIVGTTCDSEGWTQASSSGDYLTTALFPGAFKLFVSPTWSNPDGLRSGWYRAAGVGGFTADAARATVLTDSATVDVTLPGGHRISGTIRAADLSPVANARVLVCGRPGYCESARTASDGTYRTDALDDGAYTVEVSAPIPNPRGVFGGWYDPSSPDSSTRLWYRAARIVLGVSDATGVDLTLAQGRTITGQVVDPAGVGVAGARVEACSAYDCVDAVSAADGTVALAPLDDGLWRVSVDRPGENPLRVVGGWYAAPGGYAASEAGATPVEVSAGTPAPITIRLPRGALVRGKALTAVGGLPVTGATVLVCQSAGATCDRVSVNAAGDYTTGALAAGSYTVSVDVSERHPLRLLDGAYWTGATDGTNLSLTGAARTTVTLGTSDLTLSTMRLPQGRIVSGRVTASDGTTPIVDAYVQACPVTFGSGVCRADFTDANGDFTTGTLLTGAGFRLRIHPTDDDPNRVLGGWYAAGATGSYTATEAGATTLVMTVDRTNLAIRLPRGSAISGRIKRADTSTGVPYAAVSVFTPDGFQLQTTYADANGDYTTGTLAAGPYQVYVEGSDELLDGWYAAGRTGGFATDRTAATSIAVSGQGPRGIDVTLPRRPAGTTVTVSGAVQGNGSGVRGADLGLCSTTTGDCLWTTADLDGTFIFRGVPADRYRLRVTAPVGAGLGDGWYLDECCFVAADGGIRVTRDGALASAIVVAGAPVALAPLVLPAIAPVTAPVVTAPPAATSVAEGSMAVFTAEVSAGTTPVVWWESATSSLGPWSHVGGDSTVLAVQALAFFDGFWYRAVFANAGGVAYTSPARLTVRVRTSQTIAFTPATSAKAGSSVTLGATTTSGLPITFVSYSTGVCRVTGTTLSFVAGGSCIVEAQQGGNELWAPAQPVRRTITVSLVKPTLTERFFVGTSTTAVTSATIRKGTYLTVQVATDKRLSGKSVALWVQTAGVWKRLVVVKIDAYGKARYKFRPSVTMKYQWRFTATGIWASSVSSIYTVTVR